MINATEALMPAPARKRERRCAARTRPEGDLVVCFHLEAIAFRGRVDEVSPRGLSFFLEGRLHELPIPLGTLLDVQVVSANENTPRTARLCWMSVGPDGLRVGVELLDAAQSAPRLNMDRTKIDPAWALRIPASLGLRRQVLPFAADDHHVHVACVESIDAMVRQALEKALSMPVQPEPADPASLKRAIDRVYADMPRGAALRTHSVDVRSAQEVHPEDVVGLCDELLHAAILRQASDIHIDPEPAGLHIRFRVDGVLDTYRRLPMSMHNGLISRLKVLGSMDIAEKRAPQDGGFKHRFGRGGQTVDIRQATLPTRHGERMTIRLLALQTEALTLEKLGMSPRDLQIFEETIDRPHGLILLTGPTGSGKSTTLYAAIRRLLQRESLNVLTVEDPIEYEIPGVAQAEVDQADKVTFIKALRSLLRHDPDVLMIGEIRDAETADVAIKASLTGHLVFSTLHTNSAVSVVTRLIDMGVDRYLVAATLRLAVAQRLVRQLCPHCRKARMLSAAESAALGRVESCKRLVHDPVGCIYCGKRGYIGRIGLFELLTIDDEWARLIARGAEENELLGYMHERQVRTLSEDGFEKLAQGMTSVREVMSAVAAW
jgi:general secretion pathway protein E